MQAGHESEYPGTMSCRESSCVCTNLVGEIFKAAECLGFVAANVREDQTGNAHADAGGGASSSAGTRSVGVHVDLGSAANHHSDVRG